MTRPDIFFPLSQRVKTEELLTIKDIYMIHPSRVGALAYTLVQDLLDARARIAELQDLSTSQEQALGMMDRGAL